MSAKVSEAQTQRLIMDWLQAKGILAFRMQTGATLSSYKGKTRMVRYGVPGMADILAFPARWFPCRGSGCNYKQIHDVTIWIEVKAPKGVQSELQKSFQEQVEECGHQYVLARSLEDVIEALG